MVPLSGLYIPMIVEIMVDLPEPFGPISPLISPFSTLRLTPLSALTPGNTLSTLSNSRIGMLAPFAS